MARREAREYREYLSAEQRRQPGCPAWELCREPRGQDTSASTALGLVLTSLVSLADGARPARREEGEYREYLTDEQRRGAGCIASRMQQDFRDTTLAIANSRLNKVQNLTVSKFKTR